MSYAYGKNYQKSKCPYATIKTKGDAYIATCHCKENPRNLGLGVKMNRNAYDMSHKATRCLGRNNKGIGTYRDCEYYQRAKHGKTRKPDNEKTFQMEMSEYINPRGFVNELGSMFKGLFNIRIWILTIAIILGSLAWFLIHEAHGYFPAKIAGVLFGVLAVLLIFKLLKRKK